MLLGSLKSAGMVPNESKTKQSDSAADEGDAPAEVRSAKVINTRSDAAGASSRVADENDGSGNEGTKLSSNQEIVRGAPSSSGRRHACRRALGCANGLSNRRTSLDRAHYYEGWIMDHKIKPANPDSTMLLCGFRIKIFSDEYEKHEYEISPATRSKPQLLKHLQPGQLFETTMNKEALDKRMGKLLQQARRAARALLRDRNRPVGPNGWKLVALDSQVQSRSKTLWQPFRKPNSWLIVLRGGAMNQIEVFEEEQRQYLPNRYDNPWDLQLPSFIPRRTHSSLSSEPPLRRRLKAEAAEDYASRNRGQKPGEDIRKFRPVLRRNAISSEGSHTEDSYLGDETPIQVRYGMDAMDDTAVHERSNRQNAVDPRVLLGHIQQAASSSTSDIGCEAEMDLDESETCF
ncbi:hypothetical protein DL98DRAFT_23986 [Cadophora sp. DSE1049]|nr:hypothetical protein DL98DRAFT_23986 [Cadophora sp. DSE1049]